MAGQIVAGVDIGSTTVKLTVYNGVAMEHRMVLAGWNPREEAEALLAKTAADWQVAKDDFSAIVGTGYGRENLQFLSRSITEITCHARGAEQLVPGVKTVIDIGGQDAKAIRVENGRVLDFVMNDKCAAGTGRFVQVIANALGFDVAAAAKLVLEPGEKPCRVSSMCTVFAESEAVGLLHRGHSPRLIMAGIYDAIAARIVSMADKIIPDGPLVFTGGVARNEAFGKILEQHFALPVIVPKHALYAGSIGAALYAWDQVAKDAVK